MHRDVGFLNEPKALWHEVYPEEDLIGSYSRGPAKYYLDKDDVTDDIKRITRRLYSSYLLASFSQRVVDKYPEIIFRVPFVRAIFPDAKFLFLVRNGWDTCYSIDGWSKRLGIDINGETHDWWGVNKRKWKLLVDQVISMNPDFKNNMEEIRRIDCHTDMAAIEWTVTMREGLHLTEKFPDCVHMIRYEDMATNTLETIGKILEFCELSHDQKLFDYAVKTLSPVPSKKTFDLHPTVRPVFDETMAVLGY